jgi:hypothetical protein
MPSEDEIEREAAPPHPTSTWQIAGLLVVAELVGVGVMSLSTAFAQLGWGLGVIFLVVWTCLALGSAYFIVEARAVWPQSLRYADLAYHAFGKSDYAMNGVGFVVYLNFFLLESEYLLVISQCLGLIFYDHLICRAIFVAIAFAAVLPLLQLRFLGIAKWLMVLNVIAISTSLLLALIVLTVDPSPSRVPTEVVASDLTIISFFSAQALFSFAYSGAAMYLEIISEMKDPDDFFFAVSMVSFPGIAGMYLLAGAWGYGILGYSSSLLIANMPQGPALRVSAIFLMLHILVTASIPGRLLATAMHRAVSLSTINETSARSYLIRFALSGTMLFCAAVLAVVIPGFTQFTSLVGSLTLPLLGYMFPIMFVVQAHKKKQEPIPWWKYMVFAFVLVFVSMTMVIGTISAVEGIQSSYGSGGDFCTNDLSGSSSSGSGGSGGGGS